jgi:hypothetical protein
MIRGGIRPPAGRPGGGEWLQRRGAARLKLERLHLAGPQDEAEMDRQANQIGLWAEAEMLAFDIGLGYTPVPAAPPTQ